MLQLWQVLGLRLPGFLAGGMENAALSYGISAATEVLKWFTAVCLVLTAFFYTEGMQGISLLAGTVIYAVSLAADRIWSLYDPIIGGWFPEWGGIILTGIFGMFLWRELTEGYRMRLIYEEQSRQMELRLLMQKEHYQKLTDALEEASRTRHDFRQYIRTASILLEQDIMKTESVFSHVDRRAPKNADTSMLLQEHVCGCNLTLLCVTAGAKRYKVQIFSRGSRENENF